MLIMKMIMIFLKIFNGFISLHKMIKNNQHQIMKKKILNSSLKILWIDNILIVKIINWDIKNRLILKDKKKDRKYKNSGKKRKMN